MFAAGLSIVAPAGLYSQSARVMLHGHMRPGVATANDRGRVDASLQLQHVTLLLQPSAAQQAELSALIANQQDPSSAEFHQWLTPEQYADRFGLAQSNIDQITAWLGNQNLHVDSVGRGRTTITFSGNVRDVENAFQTEIHNYVVNGETHFANSSEPSVPSSIAGSVLAVHGLDDFRMKPRTLLPHETSSTGSHNLAPEDVATIFDIAPLYSAGITGKSQSIAVVGQTAINMSDIDQFRSYFNLSATEPTTTLVPNTTNPGVNKDELPEADLDIEWSGAVAPDAQIDYVYSNDAEISLAYVVDNNIAPVISMSYGLCEAMSGNADLTTLNAYAQQASAQGMSWIAASGDDGANDCYGGARAPSGLSVDAPGSVPGVTAVGGTRLNDASGTFWNSTNTVNHGSALSYIPEVVWNDTVADGTPSASGGGASAFFSKPTWQTGTGVPADNARDVPDIAMPASADHDGYFVYTGGSLQVYGGTSVGAPFMAGVAALLNQYLVTNGIQKTPGVGSLDPRLYQLAASAPNAFHDVTSGNNDVPSCSGRTCVPTQIGFNAGVAYDQTTGWGSIDAYNLITAWPGTAAKVKASVTMQLTSSAASLNATTTSTVLTASVTTGDGVTPTGSVTFYAGSALLGTVNLSGSGLTATAAYTATATQLGSGTVEITALYGGDSSYGTSSASTSVTVLSATTLAVNGVTSAASFQNAYSPGMIISLFGQNLAGSIPALPSAPLPTNLGGTVVTINGTASPLYYVSPTQINLQIPWQIAVGSTPVIEVSASGQTTTTQIPIAAHAPEIFGDTNNLLVPYQSTGRGQSIALYATGDGLFKAPAVTTGATPSALLTTDPSTVSVTIGGVPASVFFVGVPIWSVGVTQINFTIPSSVPLGREAVVLTVAGASSSPVYITVTQ